jgi:hypothetical protein
MIKFMKRIVLLPLLVFPLLALRCEKDSVKPIEEEQQKEQPEEPTLPPITQEGKGTFGCLVNGEVWLPETCCGSIWTPEMPELTSIYYPNSSSYFLGGRKMPSFDEEENFAFNISNFSLDTGSYVLTNYGPNQASEGIYRKCIASDENNDCLESVKYSSSSIYTGEFHVAFLDTSKQVISGTFWFTAQAENGDTVHITDGRFDMPYGIDG